MAKRAWSSALCRMRLRLSLFTALRRYLARVSIGACSSIALTAPLESGGFVRLPKVPRFAANHTCRNVTNVTVFVPVANFCLVGRASGVLSPNYRQVRMKSTFPRLSHRPWKLGDCNMDDCNAQALQNIFPCTGH
ncbi:hypothetical protein VTK56DRAFT_7045 [Thermocarpiscus australiensis]